MQACDTSDLSVDQLSRVALGSVDDAPRQIEKARPDRLQPSSKPDVANNDDAPKDWHDSGQNAQDSNDGREIVSGQDGADGQDQSKSDGRDHPGHGQHPS